MADFVASMRRLVGRLAGRAHTPERSSDAPLEQVFAVLDGASAVAITEACAAEAAGVTSTGLGGDEAVAAFEHRVANHRANLLGRAVSGVDASDARGAIATTLGLSMSGLRATAFVGAGDVQSAHDQLVLASGRHLPLVVHVACRATSGPGIAVGSGHDAYHAVAGAGLVQLFAANVQEAVDLSLVARRVAERTLVPVLVAVDWEQTARSLQDVQLPSAELVRAYLGAPGDMIDSPTPAQTLVFGTSRRRVPRWHDLARPAMHGAVFGTESFGVAAAARRPFFDDHVPAALDEALVALGEVTGRHHGLLREYEVDRAEVLVVAQGAAIETAMAVADHVRRHDKQRVGVVGVTCLRPLPGARLAALCAEARRVVVMERTDGALSADPPLMREVLAAAYRGAPAKGHRPSFVSAVYGLGGLPLRAGDLRAAILGGDDSPVYVGVSFAPEDSALPKRQALNDRVRRDYPEVSRLQRRVDELVDVAPPNGFVAGVFRIEALAGASAARIAATTVGAAASGHVRATTGSGWERWGRHACDRVRFAPDVVPGAGDEAPLDVALVCAPHGPLTGAAAYALRKGGAVLIDTPASIEAMVGAMTPRALARLRVSAGAVFRTAARDGESPAEREERLGGALLGVLVTQGRADVTARKLVSARTQALDELTESDREARVAAFSHGLSSVEAVVLTGEGARRAPAATPPSAVAQLRARDEHVEQALDSLPRFWNEVGVLYEGEDAVAPHLSADPYLATGMVPPLSAALRGGRHGAEVLPRFDASKCTGCARCWLRCPDGAIAPAVHGAGELLQAGAALAKARSVATDPLRPMVSKLAPMVNAHLASVRDVPTSAKELLEQACGAALEAAPLPEDRKQALLVAFAGTTAALGDLPLARTKTLFDDPERVRAGSGGLLSIAVDPGTCKGCGVCIAACDDGALVAEPATDANVDAARAVWWLWQRLPDTGGDSIARAREHDDLGDLAAILLSRHAAFAMAGADGAEPGSGAKLALRLVLGAAEFHLQRRMQTHVEQVQTRRVDVGARLRETLAQALPTGDLDGLARKLASVTQSAAGLAELGASDEGVDVARTKRLVSIARDLDDLHERLTVGPFGLGRARLGLVVAADSLTEGISAFPYNPFQVPTVVDVSGEAAALARGTLEGQTRAAAEDLAILRRAKLALDNPTRAALADAELARLRWEDMTEDERSSCPPVVVIGSSASFTDRALARLLDGDLPVMVVLLSGGAGDGDDSHWAGRTALGALAFGLSNPNVFVLQSSLAFPQHLGSGLARAFAHRGPSLVHLHAPSPAQHGFATDQTVAHAELAVRTRAFPLVVFDPSADGVFGTHVSLDGNPSPTDAWCVDDDGRPMTPATWAASESRFASWFGPAPASSPTPIGDYLSMDPAARARVTPALVDDTGARTLAAACVSVCERREREWRVLSELAGVVTPFTDRVRQEAAAAVADAHAGELAARVTEHAERMGELRAAYRAEAAAQVRDRLMALAGYHTNGHSQESE